MCFPSRSSRQSFIGHVGHAETRRPKQSGGDLRRIDIRVSFSLFGCGCMYTSMCNLIHSCAVFLLQSLCLIGAFKYKTHPPACLYMSVCLFFYRLLRNSFFIICFCSFCLSSFRHLPSTQKSPNKHVEFLYFFYCYTLREDIL